MSERDLLPLPPELGRLSTFIDSHIECLAGCNSELRSIALCAAKHVFDWALQTERSSKPHIGALLATFSEVVPPQTRSQTRSSPNQRQKPRKNIDTRETPLPSLFVDGMNTDQIWQQLDLRATRVCENLQVLLGEDESENSDSTGEDSGETEDEDEDETDTAEMNISDDSDLWEELGDEEEQGSSTAEGVINLREEISDDDDDHGPSSMMDAVRSPELSRLGSYSQGHSAIDDDFFNLATFNAETSEVGGKGESKRKLDFIVDEDSTEESEVDLFGSVDDPAGEGVDNDPELFYNDFFEPPSAKRRCTSSSKVRFHERVSVKKIQPVGKGMPVSSMDDEASDSEEESDFTDDDDDSS